MDKHFVNVIALIIIITAIITGIAIDLIIAKSHKTHMKAAFKEAKDRVGFVD